MSVVLVIDDEPSILHAFRRAFHAPEVTLLTASSAVEGLETVSQRHPDVVIQNPCAARSCITLRSAQKRKIRGLQKISDRFPQHFRKSQKRAARPCTQTRSALGDREIEFFLLTVVGPEAMSWKENCETKPIPP